MLRYPTVLTIAGSDSGGGAGIQADLKTIASLGAYGTSVITALTAQNTQGVTGIMPVPPAFVRQQLAAVFSDFQVDVVKIGMVNSVETAIVIAEAMDEFRPPFVVYDPVMAASSGANLMDIDAVGVLWTTLFARTNLVTPNIPEAEILTGKKIDSEERMVEAAEEMVQRGCRAVLIKGGHLQSKLLKDVLVQRDLDTLSFESVYVPSPNLHGTGCTLASAIATYVAMDHGLAEAVLMGKQYIHQAIVNGRDVRMGEGSGPLNHLFAPQKMQKR